MNRYVNPHMQQQHMMNRNIQQPMMQQPMMQQPMQQPMQQQAGPVMLANGMIMLPNGMIVHPSQLNMQPGMQPNMMPMQGNMQPGMIPMQPNMIPMQPNVNRFGNQNTTVNNGLSITATENDAIGNRYQQTGAMEMQTPQQEYIHDTFSVHVEKNIQFDNNTKVVLNSYIEEIKDAQISYGDDKCTLTDCFEEAVEWIIENGNEEGNKLITIQNFIVTNNFYKTVGREKFNELILDNDIKSLYKTLKTAFPTLTNKYDINLINSLDTILTDYINDYIRVNAETDVSIDSFMNDFNDLLKVVRNNEEDLEDSLIEYMNKFIESIKGNIDILSSADGEYDNATCIPENYNMCYVDKFSYELGINNAYSKFVKVADNIVNTFIKSLSKGVCSKLNANNFFLITIDRVIVKIMQDTKGNTYIKKIL